MKQLILIRHAKSSWDDPMQKDFDRPLNDRGLHDAPLMAKRLAEKQVKIDAFVSSPALRAFTTANFFMDAYHRKQTELISVPQLYHAAEEVYYEVITKFDNTFDSIAVFSHNPGLTDFVNDLTSTAVDNIPTCGVFAIKIAINNWKDFEKAPKTFWFFDYPKL